MSEQTTGVLYGVGVGPGDPELLTLKAAKVLGRVDVVFAAASPKNGYSLAFNTAREAIPPDTEVVRLPFPMTGDAEVLRRAWRENAAAVRGPLEQGRDVAFITIGDPLTYSTFGYLLETLRAGGCRARAEVIPGITAYHAAAARLGKPLVEANQSLTVVSGVGDPALISRLAETSENLVIMKSYRQFDQIVETVETLPVPCTVAAVSQIGLPDERVTPDATGLKGQKIPYLTLCIVQRQKGGEA